MQFLNTKPHPALVGSSPSQPVKAVNLDASARAENAFRFHDVVNVEVAVAEGPVKESPPIDAPDVDSIDPLTAGIGDVAAYGGSVILPAGIDPQHPLAGVIGDVEVSNDEGISSLPLETNEGVETVEQSPEATPKLVEDVFEDEAGAAERDLRSDTEHVAIERAPSGKVEVADATVERAAPASMTEPDAPLNKQDREDQPVEIGWGTSSQNDRRVEAHDAAPNGEQNTTIAPRSEAREEVLPRRSERAQSVLADVAPHTPSEVAQSNVPANANATHTPAALKANPIDMPTPEMPTLRDTGGTAGAVEQNVEGAKRNEAAPLIEKTMQTEGQHEVRADNRAPPAEGMKQERPLGDAPERAIAARQPVEATADLKTTNPPSLSGSNVGKDTNSDHIDAAPNQLHGVGNDVGVEKPAPASAPAPMPVAAKPMEQSREAFGTKVDFAPERDADLSEPPSDTIKKPNTSQVVTSRNDAPVAPSTPAAHATLFAASTSPFELQKGGVNRGLSLGLDGISPYGGLEMGASTLAHRQIETMMQSPAMALPARLAVQIADVARQLPDGPVEISLSPEELGKVRLTFQVSDTGAMTVVVAAERAETLELMRRNADSLLAEFSDLGYENSSFQFEHGGQQSSDDDSNPKKPASQASHEAAGTGLDRNAPDMPTPTRIHLDGSAGMDLRL
ncbi:flagellar hook-length control protein FliK [Pacificibacter sp.]|uniref:flagellar hook-length control protein FliK n=1 Tax=Pacificibacter sp. TaxID=1917866 RepID=UPI00321A5D3D